MGKKSSKKTQPKSATKAKKVTPAALTKQPLITWKKIVLVMPILLLTIIAFSPVFDAEFVNWDDDKNFYENELITSINDENLGANLRKIFVTPVIGNYNPLPIATFAIEKKMFGLDQPFYWHLNNVLLHLLCVFLVYLIGLRLKLSTVASLFFAALFAIHPLRVESVAWVTERKDVLFGLFYLWAMYLYIKDKTETKSILRHVFIVLLFGLSLFSKIQAVIFPISLVLIDYWFDGKLTWKSIFSKIHLFGLSLFFGILGIYMLKDQGSLESAVEFSILQRIFIGSYSYLIYYIKALIPFRMSPLYPYPQSFPWYFYPSILSFAGAGILLCWSYVKEKRILFFGIAFFTANIFFLLQILGAGQGFIADRFTYISYIGLFFILAKYLDQYSDKLGKPIFYSFAAIPVLIYSVMTFNQSKIWENSGTLWTHVLKYYQNITTPYGNRANYYRDMGKRDLALADYASTIRLKPNEPGPYNSRARLYFDSGLQEHLPLALQEYNKAIELDPDKGEYYTNRGATYARLGQMDNALADLNKSVEVEPTFLNAYLNRSVVFSNKGDYRNALMDIEHYLEYKPYSPDLWYECGRFHIHFNEYDESLKALNNAIRYNPNKGVYYVERAKAHYSIGNKQKAKQDITRAKQYNVDVPQNVLNTIMGN